jgi:FemAB-related protein (PEP-CTERM system-associated)
VPIRVQEFQEQYAKAWDTFVLGHQHGSPFHLLAWRRSIEETFGYTPRYLIALDGSRVRAVLPLFIVRNLRLRRILISSPFAVYGGVLADSQEAKAAIKRHVEQLAKSLRIEYVELRNAYPEQCLGFSPLSRYVTFSQPIGPDEGSILTSMRNKARNMARKGMKLGLSTKVRTGRIQTDEIRAFDALYSANLKRLGTPRFPRKFFAALLRNFQGRIEIRETLHDDEVVAVAMNFYFRDRVLPYYAASDWSKNHLAPNNFLYFDLMRAAGAAGCRTFDFGRSRKFSGSYEFKRHWGMAERELPYEILSATARGVPNFTPDNSKLHIAMKIWRRLPSAVTHIVGPRLVRYVP